jgi:hypothetical protein
MSGNTTDVRLPFRGDRSAKGGSEGCSNVGPVFGV